MYEKGSGSQGGTSSDSDVPKWQTSMSSGIQEDRTKQVSGTPCSFVSRMASPKKCRCGKGYCKILTSTRVHSRGRRFYCCPHSSGADNHGCGMFEWVVEECYPSSSNVVQSALEDPASNPPIEMGYTSPIYARGYLEGVIKGSKLQIHALKDVLAALNKLDVNKK